MFAVYILSNKPQGLLYIGVTNNLIRRMDEHKSHGIRTSFTRQYNVDKLMYYELIDNAETAIQREKQLKHWNRVWKLELIEKNNPGWNDLSGTL